MVIQVGTWISWHRWTVRVLLVLLVHAVLPSSPRPSEPVGSHPDP